MTTPIQLGGPKEMHDALVAAGRTPGPISAWIGSWCIKSGYGALDSLYSTAKTLGVDPLVQFWWWGDQISPSAITNGVQDPYQGVFKTRAQALAAATEIGKRAQAAGVSPIVVVETEFNKGGCDTSPVFTSYFVDAVAAIRAACPSARVVFAPGGWGNLTATTQAQAGALAVSDLIGTQALACVTRGTSVADYEAIADHVAANLAAIRAAGGRAATLPAIITDMACSTYGGGSPTAPFGGGSGTAMDASQVRAFQRYAALLPSMNVVAVIARSLTDTPTFDVSNYFGYGERYWGVVRADGSKKPGYDALLSLASPTTSTSAPAPVPALTSTTAPSPSPVTMPATATFRPKPANEYWTEVEVTPAPTGVEVHLPGGVVAAMKTTPYGSWSYNSRVPDGASVFFVAKYPDGSTATSPTYKATAMTVTTPPAPAPAPASTSMATPAASTTPTELDTANATIATLRDRIQRAAAILAESP